MVTLGDLMDELKRARHYIPPATPPSTTKEKRLIAKVSELFDRVLDSLQNKEGAVDLPTRQIITAELSIAQEALYKQLRHVRENLENKRMHTA